MKLFSLPMIATSFLLASAASAEVFQLKHVATEASFLSDDGSTIRNMPSAGLVQSVHCELAPGEAIQASRHKTVTQIWYVLNGNGEIWLKEARDLHCKYHALVWRWRVDSSAKSLDA